MENQNNNNSIPDMASSPRHITDIPVGFDSDFDHFSTGFPRFNFETQEFMPSSPTSLSSPTSIHHFHKQHLQPDTGRPRSPLAMFNTIHTQRKPMSRQHLRNLSLDDDSQRQYGSLPRHIGRRDIPVRVVQKGYSDDSPHHIYGTPPKSSPRFVISNAPESPISPNIRYQQSSSPRFGDRAHQQRDWDDELEKLKQDFFHKTNMFGMPDRMKDQPFPKFPQENQQTLFKDDVDSYQPPYNEPKSDAFPARQASVPEAPSGDDWSVEFALHDFSGEDILITVSGSEMTVKASAHFNERGNNVTKEYSNSVALPTFIDTNFLIAALAPDGLLTVFHRAPPSYQSIYFEGRQN